LNGSCTTTAMLCNFVICSNSSASSPFLTDRSDQARHGTLQRFGGREANSSARCRWRAQRGFADLQAFEDLPLHRRSYPLIFFSRSVRAAASSAARSVMPSSLWMILIFSGFNQRIESISSTPSGTSRRSFSSRGGCRCCATWSRCRRSSRRSREAGAAGSRR